MRLPFLASSFFLATLASGTVLAQTATPVAAAPQSQTAATPLSPAAGAAAQLVDTFMTDIASGQFEAARQLMTPDAVVLANGHVLGNRDGYINGPAKVDGAALRATTHRELLHRNVQAGNDLSWVVSEKRLRGTVPGAQTPRDIVVTETMLLARTAAGWKITHIHWSTRQAS